MMTGQKLSEYHTGYRAFSSKVLKDLPLLENSDDFVFDNQMLIQIFHSNFKIGEITASCSYNKDCSSISFRRSVIYGMGVLKTVFQYIFQKWGVRKYKIFDNANGRKLDIPQGSTDER